MMDRLILSRLKRRVEAALAVGLLLSLPALAAVGADRPDLSELNENREPDPSPQVELPAHSDYIEAKTLLNQHKWEEGAIVLRAVLKRTPEFFPAAIDLARALSYLGRREEALTLLGQTAAKQTGARQAAIITRIRVLSRMFLAQKDFQIYQDGLNQLSLRKYRPALDRFEKALAAEPDNIEVLARIGECLVLDGDFDSAAERLRLAKRLDPYEAEVSLWLGRALHQRGELSDAVTELKLAYEGLTTSERAPIWYSEALLSAGNRKAAVSVLEADAEAQPFHLSGIVTLARMRSEIFRDGSETLWSARKELQVALSRLPEYAANDFLRSESELGVELRAPSSELKSEISTLLAQLDNRIRDLPPRTGSSRSQH